MGTGSFSPSPSGSGGNAGEGLYGSLDGNISDAGKQKKVNNDSTILFNKISGQLQFLNQFSSPILNHAYKALFDLSFDLFQRKSWDKIQEKYGIDAGAGCLRRWVTSVLDEHKEDTPDNRKLAKIVLDSFLIKALKNNFDTYLEGDANTILKAANRKIFDSTSSNFLGLVLGQSLKGQIHGINVKNEDFIQTSATLQANKIIYHFEKQFKDKPYKSVGIDQVSYHNLFDVFSQEKEWLKKEFKTK